MIRILYTILISCYKLGHYLAAPFSRKARAKLEGLSIQNRSSFDNLRECVLIHCASLGEYEQVRPVIQWILKNTPHKITVSFFSPSGFQNCVLDNRVSKCYLPFDTPGSMNNFLERLNPHHIIINKNEWWWNFIHAISEKNTPLYAINQGYRKEHYFIKWPLPFFKKGFQSFDKIFIIDKVSKALISGLNIGTSIVSGDTKQESVALNNTAKTETTFQPIFIYGSIWMSDIDVINKCIDHYPNHAHVLYPHDLGKNNISKLSLQFDHLQLLKDISSINTKGIYLMDAMGKLKYDYAYADIAYIGGGFGKGLHNALEPLHHGVATIIGPNHNKAKEIQPLIDKNLLFMISTHNEIESIFNQIEHDKEGLSLKLKSYFQSNKSATEIICKEIFQY